MSKSLFTGTLENGVGIELIEAESFTGKTEFAVRVMGQVASVSAVSIIRNGDIQVKTTSNRLRIKPAAPVAGQSATGPGTAKPNLQDI